MGVIIKPKMVNEHKETHFVLIAEIDNGKNSRFSEVGIRPFIEGGNWQRAKSESASESLVMKNFTLCSLRKDLV